MGKSVTPLLIIPKSEIMFRLVRLVIWRQFRDECWQMLSIQCNTLQICICSLLRTRKVAPACNLQYIERENLQALSCCYYQISMNARQETICANTTAIILMGATAVRVRRATNCHQMGKRAKVSGSCRLSLSKYKQFSSFECASFHLKLFNFWVLQSCNCKDQQCD